MSSYSGVHSKLKRTQGLASEYTCRCGKPAQEWAYQHTGDTLYDGTSDGVHWDRLAYSENLDDYEAMCISCHRTLDAELGDFGDTARANVAIARQSRYPSKPPVQKPYRPAHPGLQLPPVLPAHW